MPAVFAGFLAGIRARGTPPIVECLRSDSGAEFTKGEFVALLNPHRVRREYTPVDSPKYDGVVERRIALVLEAAMASCLEPPRLLGGVPLPPTGPLLAEACVQARITTNASARVSDKPDIVSPFQKLYGRATFSRLLPFLKPGFHNLKRVLESEPKAKACFFLSSGRNHSVARCCWYPAAGRTPAITLGSTRGKRLLGCCLPHGRDTPSFAPKLPEVLTPPEDKEYGMSRHRYRQERHLAGTAVTGGAKDVTGVTGGVKDVPGAGTAVTGAVTSAVTGAFTPVIGAVAGAADAVAGVVAVRVAVAVTQAAAADCESTSPSKTKELLLRSG